MEVTSLKAALTTSNDINERMKGRAKEVDELRERVEDLQRQLLSAQNAAASSPPAAVATTATATAATPAGVTMGDLMDLLEKYKYDNLLHLISERVFIHVVAPKTILKIGEGVPKAFLPPPPSDATVRSFISKEVLPSFTQVFATIEKLDCENLGTEPASPPRSAVEAHLAPDGCTAREYAEKFSSTLTGFIKKCVLESAAR